MPKTRDSFAFRNFDPERILQRRFFKDLHFDANKLQSLSTTDFDSFDLTKEKLSKLSFLIFKAIEYQKHIMRHGDRLTKYARALEYKIATDETADIEVLRKRHKRVDELSMKYCGAVTAGGITSYFLGGIAIKDVGGLCKRIGELGELVDKKIKKHYRKIFAGRLRQARQATGLSQRKFANLIGMSPTGYCQYENGQSEPNIPMLINLSEILNRSTDWLLGRIDIEDKDLPF